MARRSGWRIPAILALFIAALAPTALDTSAFSHLGAHAPILMGSTLSAAPAPAVRPGDPSLHRRVGGPSGSRLLLAVLVALLGLVGPLSRGLRGRVVQVDLRTRHRDGPSGLRGPPLLTT